MGMGMGGIPGSTSVSSAVFGFPWLTSVFRFQAIFPLLFPEIVIPGRLVKHHSSGKGDYTIGFLLFISIIIPGKCVADSFSELLIGQCRRYPPEFLIKRENSHSFPWHLATPLHIHPADTLDSFHGGGCIVGSVLTLEEPNQIRIE